MDIVILNSSEKPIYEQIYEQVASQIVNGGLEAGFCLPSIRTVARELRVSVITVKSAWEKLENDGLVHTRPGKGCFVASLTPSHLENARTERATERLRKELPYYKTLGLTKQELLELVEREYD